MEKGLMELKKERVSKAEQAQVAVADIGSGYWESAFTCQEKPTGTSDIAETGSSGHMFKDKE